MALPRTDLDAYFRQLLKPELFEDYAPNGLQVEGKERVKKIAFAVSATQESLREAISWGADALVVHHGVFWKHQGARPLVGPWGQRLRMAVQAELNLFAFHLPLDAHAEVGNAAALAHALGLTGLAPFGAYKKQFLGVRGQVPSSPSAADFSRHVEQVLGHPVVLASHDHGAPVRTLGIITGGANNDWGQALEAGLDAYLTGEISEYNWHDAREARVHYLAGGHHATEKFGPQALMARILRDLPMLEGRFFDSVNPA